MFSGIVEAVGKVIGKEEKGSNIRFHIYAPFQNELKIDQSISHNGVCLTVAEMDNDGYYVDVISESLKRSNLGDLEIGKPVNLERSLSLNSLLDGHLVQGHVDQRAVVKDIADLDGSWTFSFEFDGTARHALIPKGSISINGVSLTVSDLSDNGFAVSIIPYTYENTVFSDLKKGDKVNIEFDVIGKYVERLMKH